MNPITGMPVMMHIALGGQHEESVFWLDNMIARGVEFDLLGISYYPRWHGTLDDLKSNLINLSSLYKKPVNVVEYSIFKKDLPLIIHETGPLSEKESGNKACRKPSKVGLPGNICAGK